MKFLVKLAILTLSIFLVAYFFPFLIEIDTIWSALIAAILLSLVNVFIRPLLFILTQPINILTLGLFTFVLNGLLLLLVSFLVSGFKVLGLWQAVVASLLISIVSWALNVVLNGEED